MPAVKRSRRGAFLNAGIKAQSEMQAELDRASLFKDDNPISEYSSESPSSFTVGEIYRNDKYSQCIINSSVNNNGDALDVNDEPSIDRRSDSSVGLHTDFIASAQLNSEGILRERALRFLRLLEHDHSWLFTNQRPPPLQSGVQKTLFTMYPSVPRKVIRCAVGLHTNRLSYLRSIRPGYSRYSIDKTPGVSVTEAEAAIAKSIVLLRKKRLKEADDLSSIN